MAAINYKKEIGEFLKAWTSVERSVDWRTARPFANDSICPYYYDLLLPKLLETIDKLKDAPPDILRKCFVGPTNARNVFVVYLSYTKLYHTNIENRMKIFDFFLRVFKAYDARDPWTFRGNSKKYSNDEIKKIIGKIKFIPASRELAGNLGKLAAILNALIYELYTDVSASFGSDFSGPYFLSKNKYLVIKEYFGLKPTTVWPHTENYKYNSVTLFVVYSVPVKIDFYGNLRTKGNKSLINVTTSYAVIADGKQVSSEQEIYALRNYLSELISTQTEIVEGQTPDEVAKQFVLVDILQSQLLFQQAGVPLNFNDVFNRIKNKPLIVGWGIWNNTKSATKADLKFFAKIMDSQKEIYWEPPLDLT